MTQASPTVINDIADLYRILDEQPQWAEAIRSRILGSELLSVPQRLDQLTEQINELRETVSQLAATTAENTRQFAELRETAAEHTRQFAELRETVSQLTATAEEHTRQFTELRETVSQLAATAAEHTRQFAELRETVSQLAATAEESTRHIIELCRITELQTRRMNRMETDIGKVKGIGAQIRAEQTIAVIADELELFNPVQVPTAELVKFAHQLKLDRSARSSFIRADLVFLAQDAHQSPIYCAVEVSWTVAHRDLQRARRNAELLKRATGAVAQAVVAGERYEDHLNWTGVAWCELED